MTEDYSTTILLLNRIKEGDRSSCDQLFSMYSPILLKWAHGRIPKQARNYMDTRDIVQDTLMRAFDHVENIKAERSSSFFTYLRTIFINQIKQQLRKNTPFQLSITQLPNSEKAAYDRDMNDLVDYERSLELLTEEEKEAVVLRMEFGFTYQQVATLIGRPSGGAARMFISRTLVKLSGLMS